VGGDVASLHHNLLAHCEGRNWSMAGGLDAGGFFRGRLDIFNNVVYNWGGRTTDGGAHEVNFVNNYYRPGAASTYFKALKAQYGNFPGTQQYYVSGNVMPGYFDESNQAAGREATGENGGSPPTTYSPWVASPFFPSHATIESARAAYKRVLSDVGCNQPLLDDHDRRVIQETRSGSYTYTGTGPYGGSPGLPNSQDDVGGWEDYPTISRPATWDTITTDCLIGGRHSWASIQTLLQPIFPRVTPILMATNTHAWMITSHGWRSRISNALSDVP
jgi:hypothetical protein